MFRRSRWSDRSSSPCCWWLASLGDQVRCDGSLLHSRYELRCPARSWRIAKNMWANCGTGAGSAGLFDPQGCSIRCAARPAVAASTSGAVAHRSAPPHAGRRLVDRKLDGAAGVAARCSPVAAADAAGRQGGTGRGSIGARVGVEPERGCGSAVRSVCPESSGGGFYGPAGSCSGSGKQRGNEAR